MKLEASIIVALGYGNTEASRSDLHGLYLELLQHRSPTVEVALCPYNADWKARAHRWHQDAAPDARLYFVGHSYGCGWGLRRLCKYLDQCGRSVQVACLIDPIIRWFQYLLPLNVISLTRLGEFHLPSNVMEAHVWRQTNNRPPGRYVVGQAVKGRVVYGLRPGRDGETWVRDGSVTHATIDGLLPVRKAVLRLLRP